MFAAVDDRVRTLQAGVAPRLFLRPSVLKG
jgi:hypothetical protein